jgi:hypothetical protein
MCLTVFAHLVYDIPESRIRPIAFGAIDIDRHPSTRFSLGLIPRAPGLRVAAGHLRGCWTWY